MESFFQVRKARNHVTSLEDRTHDIENQIENIRNKISEIRKNIRNRETQIEENESNLVQTGNERFIKIVEKENYLLDQERVKFEKLTWWQKTADYTVCVMSLSRFCPDFPQTPVRYLLSGFSVKISPVFEFVCCPDSVRIF